MCARRTWKTKSNPSRPTMPSAVTSQTRPGTSIRMLPFGVIEAMTSCSCALPRSNAAMPGSEAALTHDRAVHRGIGGPPQVGGMSAPWWGSRCSSRPVSGATAIASGWHGGWSAVVPISWGRRREPRWTRQLGDGGHPWLLTADERGNEAAGLPAWREGNAVRPLVDGRCYLPVLAAALARADPGDAVLFAGWRADPDELLDDDGPPLAAALVGAARRGTVVRGLLWRSHLEVLGYSLGANRALAQAVNAVGGQVLLDHRVRPLGSHHQKFVVLTRDGGPDETVFVGGIDLARSRRDGHAHRGDRQARPFSAVYGPTPAWHDVSLQLHGPAVRDVEQSSGSGGRTRPPSPGGPGTRSPIGCAGSIGRRSRSHHRPRPHPDRPVPAPCSCCAAIRGAIPPIRSRRTGSAVWRGATPRCWPGPVGWSMSRTSTCGRGTSPGSSPPRCAAPRRCG